MSNKNIISIQPLGFPWETRDPFIFCVHHRDLFPKGNDEMGPSESLSGRNIGQDFVVKDGWRMYHGQKIPGFPYHPHRGFETVTIVKEGLVDHTDSLGASARFGNGDVQWMTAGKGVLHSEMFPLLNQNNENPAELFQIWINLPKKSKFVEPHFKMLWNENIPVLKEKDSNGNSIEIKLIAGNIQAGNEPCFLLILQGKPINEPVVQYGPFVMNTEAEIQEAFQEYQQTQFGGWPWPNHEQAHPRNKGRFAIHADGKEEIKETVN